MKRIAILSLLSIAAGVSVSYALPSTTDDTDGAARAFVERVWRALALDELDCVRLGSEVASGGSAGFDREPATLPPGAVRCGRIVAGEATRADWLGEGVHRIARTHAFDLASTGVPLLELESWTVPPTQLVGMPGFASFADVPGFDVVGYLIEQHRVGVWTDGRLVVISLEPTGPFPEILPAGETAD